MSWSSDPTQVDDETLRRSMERDLLEAFAATDDASRLRWLEEATATTRELLRRAAAKTVDAPAARRMRNWQDTGHRYD